MRMYNYIPPGVQTGINIGPLSLIRDQYEHSEQKEITNIQKSEENQDHYYGWSIINPRLATIMDGQS